MTIKDIENDALDGCLLAPLETIVLITRIRRLEDAIRDAMEDKNANEDSIAPLGWVMGYTRNEWGDWIIPKGTK